MTGEATTWAGLRALHVVSAGEHLVRYIAGELGDRAHIVDISPPRARPHYRAVIRNEPAWWSVGLADVFGLGQTVLDAMAEPLPALLTPAQAAAQIPGMDRWGKPSGRPMTVDGVAHNILTGHLYPLHSATSRAVSLFAANVAAETARRRDRGPTVGKAYAQWMRIRELLPPAIRPSAVGHDIFLPSSIDPLPLPVLRSPTKRATPRRWTDALQRAHMAGWLEFVGPDGPGELAYRIRIDPAGADGVVADRTVPGTHVLPWLLGVADGRDAAGLGTRNADVIAYRALLG